MARGLLAFTGNSVNRRRFVTVTAPVVPVVPAGISAPIVGTAVTTAVNGNATLNVTAPVVPAGTLLVLVTDYQTTGTAGVITADGWNQPYAGLGGHATGTTGVQMGVYFRTATGAGSTYTVTGTNVSGKLEAVILGYPGASTVAPVAGSGEAAFSFSTTSSATQTAGPITTTGDRWLVMVTGNRGAFTYTPGAGMTERVDFTTPTTGNTGLGVFDSNGIVPAGTGLTRTATASGSSSTGGRILFALQAA